MYYDYNGREQEDLEMDNMRREAKQKMSSDNYRMTEHGLVAKFQQPCGCNAEGPGEQCRKGQELFRKMNEDSDKLFNDEMTLTEADVSLEAWQGHLGA